MVKTVNIRKCKEMQNARDYLLSPALATYRVVPAASQQNPVVSYCLLQMRYSPLKSQPIGHEQQLEISKQKLDLS